jgi:hypothetical protein
MKTVEIEGILGLFGVFLAVVTHRKGVEGSVSASFK